jgi:uncharacterized membrane protein YhaH (DUF805 family)
MKFYFEQEYYRWQNIGNGIVRNNSFLFWYKVYSIFNYYVLTVLIAIIFIIQSVKRMHDINKNGWYTLAPGYNIVLWLREGTKGQNDFGIDPQPRKIEKYYDNTLYRCPKCNYAQIRYGMKECPKCNVGLKW